MVGYLVGAVSSSTTYRFYVTKFYLLQIYVLFLCNLNSHMK